MQGEVKLLLLSKMKSLRYYFCIHVQFLPVHVYSWSCISKLESNHRWNWRVVLHPAISARRRRISAAIEKAESRLRHPRCVVVSLCHLVGNLELDLWVLHGLSWSFHIFPLLTVLTISHSTSDRQSDRLTWQGDACWAAGWLQHSLSPLDFQHFQGLNRFKMLKDT